MRSAWNINQPKPLRAKLQRNNQHKTVSAKIYIQLWDQLLGKPLAPGPEEIQSTGYPAQPTINEVMVWQKVTL